MIRFHGKFVWTSFVLLIEKSKWNQLDFQEDNSNAHEREKSGRYTRELNFYGNSELSPCFFMFCTISFCRNFNTEDSIIDK